MKVSVSDNLNKIFLNTGSQAVVVAVVKNQYYEDIFDLYEAGQRVFAENKVQDLLDKYEYFKKYDFEWHFIGHLQRNKVKYIIDKVSLIQSLDSLRLAEEISARALKANKVMDCLIQINTGSEENKYGIDFNELETFIADLQKFKGIRIVGLMAVTPFFEDSEKVRPYFKKMRSLFDEIKKQQYENVEMKYLSMGMSNDYCVAVEEGSNMVRIGSLLFY